MNKKIYTIAQILPALNTGGVERGVVEISQALVDNNLVSDSMNLFPVFINKKQPVP